MNSELADVLNSHTAGYSREEMLILQCDPLGERSPLQLKPISEDVCEQIPLFRQIYRLQEILYAGGEIKLTLKGNLPLIRYGWRDGKLLDQRHIPRSGFVEILLLRDGSG